MLRFVVKGSSAGLRAGCCRSGSKWRSRRVGPVWIVLASAILVGSGCEGDDGAAEDIGDEADAVTDVSSDDAGTADTATVDGDVADELEPPPVDLEIESDWTLASDYPGDYGMSVDFDVTHDASGASIRLQSNVAEPRGQAFATADIDATGYTGHRVRYSAFVLAEDIEGFVGLWYMVGSAEGARPLSYDNMVDRPIASADDWTEFTAVLDVPAEADEITIGLILLGAATAWLDGSRLEVVGDTVPTTNRYRLEPGNVGFEEGMDGLGVPLWWVVGGDAHPWEREIGVDTERAHEGDASGRVISTATGGRFCTLMQSIRPDNYHGKRIRLSAFIATEAEGTSTQMWMRIDGVDWDVVGFDNMMDRPIVGTTDWTEYSIVLDVPEDAWNISYGVFVNNEGTFWVDDVQLEVVDDSVPTTGTW